MEIWNKKELVEAFNRINFKPRKSLGQNFLIDGNFLNFIVKTADISPDEHILEIGAGAGLLTKLLAKYAKRVTAFEIDKDLFEICKRNLSGIDNVKLFNEDAVKAIKQIKAQKIKVVSNLPYSNYAKILLELFSSKLTATEFFAIVQFDVYKKIAASPGDKEYSAIGAVTQAVYDIKLVRAVPPEAFYPQPKVQSAFVYLKRRHQPLLAKEEVKPIYSVLKMMLSQRLKKLKFFARGTCKENTETDLLEKRISMLRNDEVVEFARRII